MDNFVKDSILNCNCPQKNNENWIYYQVCCLPMPWGTRVVLGKSGADWDFLGNSDDCVFMHCRSWVCHRGKLLGWRRRASKVCSPIAEVAPWLSFNGPAGVRAPTSFNGLKSNRGTDDELLSDWKVLSSSVCQSSFTSAASPIYSWRELVSLF